MARIEAAVEVPLAHHGEGARTIGNGNAFLTVIGNCKGRLFAGADVLVGFAGHPLLDGEPLRDAYELACAYRAGRLDTLASLNGHFAIAIVDQRENRVLFLRDLVGVCPLYLARIGDGLAFCSEYKVLRALPDFDPSLDPVAMRGFEETGWVPAGRTFFTAVRPVAPGNVTCLQPAGSGFSVTHLAGPDQPSPASPIGAGTVLSCLESAVSRSLSGRAGVPGIMLSSGVDSAVVAALVARGRTDVPVHAFTVGHGASDPEIEGAAESANTLGLRHHLRIVAPEDLSRWLPDCLWAMENPGGHDEYPCLFALCEHAREHVTVLYSGNLSDTLFGGMQLHLDLWRHLNGQPVPRGPKAAGRSILMGASSETTAISDAPPFRSLHDELVATMSRRDERMGAQAMLAARFGIDLRMPFADSEVVDLAFRIPDDQKVGPSQTKRIVRQAAALLLPGEIADRPKRIQQLLYDKAMQCWLQAMFEHLFPDGRDPLRGIYDQGRVTDLRAALADNLTVETFQRAWNAISIEIWMRLFHDGETFRRIAAGQVSAAEAVASTRHV